MSIDPVLQRFALAQPEAFAVPAEFLSENGLEPAFARLLIDQGRLSTAQADCLEAGFRLYRERCLELFRRAPANWFPPRQTNLLIAAEAGGVLPYLEPFAGTSSLLYRSDLDTHPEYVAFLLLHIERVALMRSMRAALICNLSYWFDRDSDSRRAFTEAAAVAQRPDAAAFVALGRAFEWIDVLLHDPLRPPASAPSEPYIGVNDTGLYIPKRLQNQLMALGEAAEQAGRAAFNNSANARPAAPASPNAALQSLCDWLESTAAPLIVVAPNGSMAWQPGAADASGVWTALEGASSTAIESVHADLRVIDERSRQFLDRLSDPEALPGYCPVLETGGGTYIDASRRAVVYELLQPAFDARTWSAPPYHRLLLGARVMHEWGHVAHTAKIIAVPAERKAAYTAARAELGACFAGVLDKVPARLRTEVDEQSQLLMQRAPDLPTALARKTLARVGDYLANLLCSRLIPAEEMQAYVRTNVRHHFDENLDVVSELARYAYEVQYLALAGIPREYFFRTSRFREFFVETGIISEEDMHQLFDAVGAVLAHYAIDETKLSLAATKH